MPPSCSSSQHIALLNSVGYTHRYPRRKEYGLAITASRVTPLTTPQWLQRMSLRRWYAISGDHPDLELPPTASGTRYLVDTDPARDRRLNPPRTIKERHTAVAGHDPSRRGTAWRDSARSPKAWNGAVYASRYGTSGSMIVFGGGHDDYFGSDVHAFDLATREWRRISDGYVTGSDDEYGAGAFYPDRCIRMVPRCRRTPTITSNTMPVGNDYILFKGQTELGPDVKAVAIPHLFNLDTLAWRHGPRHPAAILNSGGWTTWDASRRVVWGHSGDDGGGNAFIGFCPDGDNGDGTFGRWIDCFRTSCPGVANHNAMQIDPVRDIIVVAAHARDALYAIDPADPGRACAARVDRIEADAAALRRPGLCAQHRSPHLFLAAGWRRRVHHRADAWRASATTSRAVDLARSLPRPRRSDRRRRAPFALSRESVAGLRSISDRVVRRCRSGGPGAACRQSRLRDETGVKPQ